MGKTAVLGDWRIRRRVGGLIEQMNPFTLQAYFQYRLVFTAGLSSSPRNQRGEGSWTFNGVYTVFTYSMSSRRRNKAETLRWDICDLVLDWFDTWYGKGGGVPTEPLSNPLEWSKMTRLRRSAFHDLYQIYQVLSLHILQWSSNDALIVSWNVSGQFPATIEWYTDRKSASASPNHRRHLFTQ